MSKPYLTLKDIAARTGLTATALRFYDKQGLLSFTQRSRFGTRIFTEKDMKYFYLIRFLKEIGMPLRKIKEMLDLCQREKETLPERIHLLTQHRDFLQHQLSGMQTMLDLTNRELYRLQHDLPPEEPLSAPEKSHLEQ